MDKDIAPDEIGCTLHEFRWILDEFGTKLDDFWMNLDECVVGSDSLDTLEHAHGLSCIFKMLAILCYSPDML